MTLRNTLVSGFARRLGTWPLKLIGPNHCAEVLETVSDQMIHVAEIPGSSLGFYALNRQLLWRAGSLLTKEVDTIEWKKI